MTGRHFLTGWHLMTGLLVLLLAGIQPLLANGSLLQQGSPQRAPTPRVDPYKSLFQPPPLEQTAPAQRRTDPTMTSAPRIVCGTLVIPADPNIDPKIFIERRPDDTHYTIRAIPAPVCK